MNRSCALLALCLSFACDAPTASPEPAAEAPPTPIQPPSETPTDEPEPQPAATEPESEPPASEAKSEPPTGEAVASESDTQTTAEVVAEQTAAEAASAPPTREYVACGCGCCGGAEPADAPACVSDAELDRIIKQDKQASRAKSCVMAGCSLGRRYWVCAAE